MRRRILLAALGVFTSHAALAFDWVDLWRTPEQQAQQLLDAGKPAEAAQRFSDPRRKAFAQARAKEHAAAASTLAQQKDADSLFNRSNALAHAGKLEEALAGYEAALKQQPNDKDITRNRDLVKQALQKKQEQQQQQQGGQKGQQDQKKDPKDHSGQPDKQDQQGGQSGQNQNQSKDQKDQQKSGQQNSASSSSAASSAQAQGGGQHSSAAASSQAGAPKQGSGQSSSSAKDEVEQARRDAEAAVKASQSQPAQNAQATPAGKAGEPEPGQRGRAVQEAPKSEEALAMDQWLRRIPDDPGGLLRRKFMIEHQLKQQENGK